MKITILILPFLFFINSIFSQTENALVNEIEEKYELIKRNLNSYEPTLVEKWKESNESGQTIAYYDQADLKMIVIIWLGETEGNRMEYCFDNGQLFFSIHQYFEYHQANKEEKKTKEKEDKDFLYSNKTILKEDRYYFEKETLFLYLDKDNKEVDLTMGTNALIGQGLIAHCYKIKEELTQK